MKIYIKNNRLKTAVENDRKRTKAYGSEMAEKIARRLEALGAARNLYDLWPPYKKPERCHELKGNLAGCFSVDLKHPYRLIFRATERIEEELQNLDDDNANERWKLITEIEIVAIEDTHG